MAARTPLSKRRQGQLRATLIVLTIGDGSVAVPFILGGIGALREGQDNGVTLVILGVAILVASVVVPIVIRRRRGAALTAVHDPR